MSLIQVKNLTYSYEGSDENIFENVSFQLDTNWRLGFVGRNGRGKTTFLKLLQGTYPYSGTISASVHFSYFPFTIPDSTATALEAVEQMNPEYEYWQVAREMGQLQLDEEVLSRPYCTLSNGEQTKLQLAVLFSRDNNFLLIDEPTNHLDILGRRLVSRYLAGKRGYILVSHDRAFLDGCVDHILSINKADIQVCRGNFSTWQENKQRQDAFEQAENEKLKREIGRLEQTAREKTQWSDTSERRKIGIDPLKVDNVKGYRPLQGAKAAKTMARAKAIEKRQAAAIEEKKGLLKNIERSDSLKIYQTPFHSRRMVDLKDAAVRYGTGTSGAPASFTICQGDRLNLQGQNGCGKSSLIKLICGDSLEFTGSLWRGSGLKISYVGQDAAGLRGSLDEFIRGSGVEEHLLLAMLAKLDVSRSQLERDLSSLSAGQKKKLLLAKSICEPAHLHVWDEPLNYIDVVSRIQLEDLILAFQPTLLFVEHDEVFCNKVATGTVLME